MRSQPHSGHWLKSRDDAQVLTVHIQGTTHLTEHPSFRQLPPGEPVPGHTYRADGWMYLVVPSVTVGQWNAMLVTAGEDEVVLMSYDFTPTTIENGRLLISPTGQARIEMHAAAALRKKGMLN